MNISEAIRVPSKSGKLVVDDLRERIKSIGWSMRVRQRKSGALEVATPSGNLIAYPGDWIARVLGNCFRVTATLALLLGLGVTAFAGGHGGGGGRMMGSSHTTITIRHGYLPLGPAKQSATTAVKKQSGTSGSKH